MPPRQTIKRGVMLGTRVELGLEITDHAVNAQAGDRSTAQEVSDALEVAVGYQRVFLHCARSRVRAALERHLDG